MLSNEITLNIVAQSPRDRFDNFQAVTKKNLSQKKTFVSLYYSKEKVELS